MLTVNTVRVCMCRVLVVYRFIVFEDLKPSNYTLLINSLLELDEV